MIPSGTIPSPHPRQASLSSQLLRRVLLLAAVLGLAATGLQGWLNWRSESARLEAERASVVAAYAPGISKAVWDLDEAALKAQLSGMRHLPAVLAVEVVSPQLSLDYAKAGGRFDQDSPPTRHALLSPDGQQVIATWALRLDHDLVRQQVRAGTLRFLWVWCVQTALLAALLHLLVRRRVSAPVRSLSDHVASLTRADLSRAAPEPRVGGRNELHQLAQGITRLQLDLQRQLASLDASASALQQQREAVSALYAQQRRQFDDVLQRMADGAGLLDGEGMILLANPVWAALAGRPDAAALVGQPPPQWLRTPAWRDLMGLVRHTDAVAGVALVLGGPAGPERPVEASLSVLERDAQGQPLHLQIVLHDMTARVETERSLIEAREAALAATRAKSEFLANMSHEIRTPMNAVLGFTELALFTPLDAQQRDYLDKIRTAARSLLGVLNDILDFSKIEAGKLAVMPAPFRLDQVIEEVRSLCSVQANTKGLQFHIDVAPDVPRHLLGDALRLRQVLINLCSNAVKFTARGQVSLQVTALQVEADEAELQVKVIDTGIGMAAHTVANLFQPFTQADGSITRRHGGTGLGLAISQQLVGLMGGRIEVQSTPAVGSVFSFTLRLGRVHVPVMPAPTGEVAPLVQPQPTDLSGLRVLLVEDNYVNQEVAEALLQGVGAQVTVAPNGKAALSSLSQGQFDLVLMDVQMPEMDGYETTRSIRDVPAWAGLPIIALTAHALDSERALCLRAGMDDFLSKPFEPQALYDVLRRWRGRRHGDTS